MRTIHDLMTLTLRDRQRVAQPTPAVSLSFFRQFRCRLASQFRCRPMALCQAVVACLRVLTLAQGHAVAKAHHRLTLDQRCTIQAGLSRGFSKRAIGRELGVSHTTVLDEVKRNSDPDGTYRAASAHERVCERRCQASSGCRKRTEEHLNFIDECLQKGHSPDVIAHLSQDTPVSMSTPTVYKLIHMALSDGDPDGWRFFLLRVGRKKPGRTSKEASASRIPNRTGIEERPAEVNTRATVGQWEADTVVGAGNKGPVIVTLNERKTRFFLAMVVSNKTTRVVTDAIISMLASHADVIDGMTFDNGLEFAAHERVAQALDCKTYFARPYHSWERGANEHLNGELRRVFPKGMRFDDVTQAEVDAAVRQINGRIRKVLGYRTAAECFAEELAALQS